jgi:hypothetical protein
LFRKKKQFELHARCNAELIDAKDPRRTFSILKSVTGHFFSFALPYTMMRQSIFLLASILALAASQEQPLLLISPEITSELTTATLADGTHYDAPSKGCLADELPFHIADVSGTICAPKCAFGQCPSDVPDCVTAVPTCALQLSDGTKYCALLCNPTNLRGGECGAATCQPIQGTGICTYDERKATQQD